MLGVDLVNFPKFPRVDDARHLSRRRDLDIRQELDVDSGAELADYSGPYRRRPALHRLLAARRSPTKFLPVERGVPAAVRRRLGRRGRQALRRRHDGRDRVGGVERPDRPRARAHAGRVPARRHRLRRPEPAGAPRPTGPTHPRRLHRPVHAPARTRSSSPSPSSSRWFLGSHEYLLQCIEAWADADHRALRRSTRCSTSSARSGATRCCPA